MPTGTVCYNCGKEIWNCKCPKPRTSPHEQPRREKKISRRKLGLASVVLLVGGAIGAAIGIEIDYLMRPPTELIDPIELLACAACGLVLGMVVASRLIEPLSSIRKKPTEAQTPSANNSPSNAERRSRLVREAEAQRRGGKAENLQPTDRGLQPAAESQSPADDAGGTTPHDVLAAAERRAETELCETLKAGEFCHVLTSPQMSKSSLMIRIATRLWEGGTAIVVLETNAIGADLTVEQWYHALLNDVGRQLDEYAGVSMQDDLETFWRDNEHLGPYRRWVTAIQETVMKRRKTRVVIFVDDIDAVCSLPFPTRAFFAGLRECYRRGQDSPARSRLAFCMFGSAVPAESHNAFNMGRQIALTDFIDAEVAVRAKAEKQGRETAGGLFQSHRDGMGKWPGFLRWLVVSMSLIPTFFLSAIRFPFRRRFAPAAILAVVLILAVTIGLGVFASQKRNEAKRMKREERQAWFRTAQARERKQASALREKNRASARRPDNSGVPRSRGSWGRDAPGAQGAGNALELLHPNSPLRHGHWVMGTAFSPDGKFVATASRDMTARLWDVASGKPFSLPLLHEGMVRGVAFSPDGKLLATASWDGTARLWDVTTKTQRGPPLQHPDKVIGVAFSPDGTLLATASSDGAARLWRVSTRKLYGQPLRHTDWVMGVAFSPNGDLLATASRDKTARLWDVATGKPYGSPFQHNDWTMDVAFSPDSKLVATASKDKTARLWEVGSGEPRGQPLQHPAGVTSVTFSPDGKRIATTSARKMVIWDVTRRKLHVQPLQHKEPVWDVAFNPDGSLVATGSIDGMARLWRVSATAP